MDESQWEAVPDMQSSDWEAVPAQPDNNAAGQIQASIRQAETPATPPWKMVDNPVFGPLPDMNDPAGRQEMERRAAEIGGAVLSVLPSPVKSIPFLSKALSKIPFGSMAGNALGRVGYGTAVTTAPSLVTPEGRNNLTENVQRNALMNSLLEAGTLPFRAVHGLAELFNPEQYAAEKAANIKSQATAAKSTMDEMYRPINEKYNDYNVTLTPKNYLGFDKMDIRRFTPDVKKSYEDFLEEPTFGNLHNLQSQMGKDWARLSSNPNKINTAQTLNSAREMIKQKQQNFLEMDSDALRQYNAATEYAKNHYYPYMATPTLRKIAKGKLDTSPAKLANSIRKGTEKTVGREEINVIPEDHPLRNHLADLENRISMGRTAKVLIPTLTGGLAGEALHPGIGAALGGLTGLGSSAFGALPKLAGVAQEPFVKNLFGNISPIYYGAGRAGNVLSQ